MIHETILPALDNPHAKKPASAQRWALRAGKSPAHGSGPCSSVFFRVRKRFVILPS